MSRHNPTVTPVNIIGGSLGVGKTTTINHLMSQRPEDERWAVLVNEYGLIGLDAALIEGESGSADGQPGVEIKEVAGGCICCSAGIFFEMALVRLLQRRPDRLLIEPTGLAALSGILDTLDRKGIREAVDVRTIVCLLDPSTLSEALERPEVRDQVQAADVLLANRADLADEADLDAFDAWAASLFPKKRRVERVEHGRVLAALLDLVSQRAAPAPRAGHQHGTDHDHGHQDHGHQDHGHQDHGHQDHGHQDHGHHDHGHQDHGHQDHGHHDHAGSSAEEFLCDETRPMVQRVHRSADTATVGWLCWAGLEFDAERVSLWLRELIGLPGVRRVKAVLRGSNGWCSFNFADGAKTTKPSGYRRDSRIEFVVDGAALPDPAALDASLRGCVRTSPPL